MSPLSEVLAVLLVVYAEVAPLQGILLFMLWCGRVNRGTAVALPLRGKWWRWFATFVILVTPIPHAVSHYAEILHAIER